jgi:hypothetical protein
MLVAARPHDEAVVRDGPFVMNSREEVEQAREDYRQRRNGFEMADGWASDHATIALIIIEQGGWPSSSSGTLCFVKFDEGSFWLVATLCFVADLLARYISANTGIISSRCTSSFLKINKNSCLDVGKSENI